MKKRSCSVFWVLFFIVCCFAAPSPVAADLPAVLPEQAADAGKTAPGLSRKKPQITAEPVDFKSLTSKTTKGFVYTAIFFLLALSLYRKYGTRSDAGLKQGAIQVLARKQIGSRTALLMIQAEERKFLLAQNGDQLALLSDLSFGFEELSPLELAAQEESTVRSAKRQA